MIKNSSQLLVIATTLLFTACATAPQHATTREARAQRADELFNRLDTNHDGYLSRAELAAGLQFAGEPDLNPNLVMGLKSTKSSSNLKATRRLTKAEIDRSMKEAFGTGKGSRDANLEARITKDEFKKLVVERPKGEQDDPWEPFM